jgi:hypothetical protein
MTACFIKYSPRGELMTFYEYEAPHLLREFDASGELISAFTIAQYDYEHIYQETGRPYPEEYVRERAALHFASTRATSANDSLPW